MRNPHATGALFSALLPTLDSPQALPGLQTSTPGAQAELDPSSNSCATQNNPPVPQIAIPARACPEQEVLTNF